MLLILLLAVALLVIAAGVMAPIVAFQVKRDREEELIHRGVQYSRAMKHFVKKFGRYPTRIEELENTNQVRFLRRRYKEPITGKDFKILHMGDVQMAFGGGIAGATPAAGLNQGGAPGVAGGPGQLAGVASTFVLPGGLAAGPPNVQGQGSQASSQNQGEDAGGSDANPTPAQGGTFAAAGPGAPGTFGVTPGGGGAAGQPQVFGGGPMVGVASTSKNKSIRVFNKKEHYNEWQFIYDPSSDRGGLLTTPNQPGLAATGTSNAVQTGTPVAPGGTPGQPGSGTPPGMQTPQMPPDQAEP
jgi:type II secretory pathway pseudopilin PulG